MSLGPRARSPLPPDHRAGLGVELGGSPALSPAAGGFLIKGLALLDIAVAVTGRMLIRVNTGAPRA